MWVSQTHYVGVSMPAHSFATVCGECSWVAWGADMSVCMYGALCGALITTYVVGAAYLQRGYTRRAATQHLRQFPMHMWMCVAKLRTPGLQANYTYWRAGPVCALSWPVTTPCART